MSSSPAPLDDPRRLQALRETGLLDTPPDEAFDRLTRLATRVLGVPVALVTLVDGDRQFFKSCIGLPEPWATLRQTPLSHSFCQHTVLTGRPLVIDDARLHPELRHNLAIPDLGVVAYAGIPLATPAGETLGTFCAIDTRPRSWSREDVDTLADLAASAATEIELRMALAEARRGAEELERAYHEREEYLNATSDGVYTLDTEGRLRFVNRAAAELLGWPPDEMVGRNAHRLFHHSRPDGTAYPEAECAISAAAREGREVRVDDEVLWRRDGTPLVVAYASSPVWRDGRVVGAVVRFTDVTEQRRAAEGMKLLAEAGRRLAASLDLDETLEAVAHLAVPPLADMVMVDLVEDGVVRRVAASHADERAAALFERARAFPPRLDDGGPQARVIRTGRSLLVRQIDEEFIGSLDRGPEHAELVRALAPRSMVFAPLTAGEAVLGTLSLVRGAGRPPFDERDRELAEELGRRAALAVENARLYDAARRATRARDDMLGVVSHDLRNPVHTIFMSASFLLDLLPEESAALERGQAAIIRRAAERANRLIQDLLDITHIESGRLSLDRQPQSAASLVDEAVELARMAAAEHTIALARGEVDPSARVDVDRDRVLQALGNLIGNALKFTPAGGRVTVSARREGAEVRVSVSDTGPGIAEAQVPHLFDRYWQASRTDKRGVGLGLSIVKGIAEAHGGRVEVATAPGAGSTFTLVFPEVPGETGT